MVLKFSVNAQNIASCLCPIYRPDRFLKPVRSNKRKIWNGKDYKVEAHRSASTSCVRRTAVRLYNRRCKKTLEP